MHWQASKVAALLLGMAIKRAYPNRAGEYRRIAKVREIMKKSYCTQNNGKCETCSLVNYGLDCGNNPISVSNPRKGTKADRALKAYDGFKGGATVDHIKKLVGKELAERLTGHELGLVMSAVNRAYQEGKASAGAEMIDSNCVYINGLDRAIEWSEVGAVYEQVPFKEEIEGRISTGTRPVKTKDGELVPRFIER
jgi:hypothetical protein